MPLTITLRRSATYLTVITTELRSRATLAELLEGQASVMETESQSRMGQPLEVYEGEDLLSALARVRDEYHLPQLIRRSLVIQLWSIVEHGIRASTRLLDRVAGLEPVRIRSTDVLGFAKRHLQAVHGYTLVPDGGLLERRLRLLENLRHAFVHGGGSREMVNPKTWTTLVAESRNVKGFSTHRNFVHLERELFERLREPAYEMSILLIEAVRQRIDRDGPPERQERESSTSVSRDDPRPDPEG